MEIKYEYGYLKRQTRILRYVMYNREFENKWKQNTNVKFPFQQQRSIRLVLNSNLVHQSHSQRQLFQNAFDVIGL